MRELTLAVTRRLKDQDRRKSALELWARLAAAFEKDGVKGVERILEGLVERPEMGSEQ